MRNLIVDAPVTSFNGDPFLKDEQGTPLTLADVYLNLIGSAQAQTGAEAVQLYDVGRRVYTALRNGGSVEMEERETVALRRLVEDNKFVQSGQVASYNVVIQAQALQALELTA